MTFREKLQIEHPECIDEDCDGGCQGCPCSYGYEKMEKRCPVDNADCTRCWDREIPEEKPPEEKKPVEVPSEPKKRLVTLLNQVQSCGKFYDVALCATVSNIEVAEFLLANGVTFADAEVIECKT